MRTERSKDAHPSLIMVEMTDEHPSLLVGGLEATVSAALSDVSACERTASQRVWDARHDTGVRGHTHYPPTPTTSSRRVEICASHPRMALPHITSHMWRTRSAYGRGCASMASRHRHALHHTVVPSATGRVDADAASDVGRPASGQVCWHARPPGASR